MSARQKFEDPTAKAPMAQAPAPTPTGFASDGNLAEPMPLGMFLRGVALIYHLRPKAIQKRVKAPKAIAGRARPKKLAGPLALMLVISVVALFGVRFSSGETQGVLPMPLRAEWTTEDPDYKNRGFTISASALTFRTGADADSFTVHKIRHVTQSASGEDTTNFAIDYESEGGLVTWEFQYIQRPKPTIRFTHQKDLVWKPAGAAVASGR